MRIYLRALEPADHKLIHEWRQDETVMNALGGNRYYVSAERDRLWTESKSIDESGGIYLAICLRETDIMIGYCSIIHIDLRNLKADLGGTVIGDPNYRGKGFGREAQTLMLKYCFDEMPLHKVYGFSLTEHIVTEKMMLALGFRIDGVLRDEVFKNGEFKSYTIYSILRDEYEQFYNSDRK